MIIRNCKTPCILLLFSVPLLADMVRYVWTCTSSGHADTVSTRAQPKCRRMRYSTIPWTWTFKAKTYSTIYYADLTCTWRRHITLYTKLYHTSLTWHWRREVSPNETSRQLKRLVFFRISKRQLSGVNDVAISLFLPETACIYLYFIVWYCILFRRHKVYSLTLWLQNLQLLAFSKYLPSFIY